MWALLTFTLTLPKVVTWSAPEKLDFVVMWKGLGLQI